MVGAGSGIGRAVAELFASRGIRTVAADLNADAVKDLAPSTRTSSPLGDAGWDATDPDACDRLLDEAVAALGTVDRVVSTVGWTAITPFLEETPEYWRRIIDVNLMSAIYLSASAGRVMKENGGGSIVLTSSEAGMVGHVRGDGVLRGQGRRRRRWPSRWPASGPGSASASTPSRPG